MLRFTRLVEPPRKLFRMTSLTVAQFQTLTARLLPLWEQAERERLSRRKRRHAIGQGRKYKLATLADKLVVPLVCYRFALTDELLGWLVGLDASNVCRWLQRLEPLLERAADPSLGLPLRRRLPPGAKKIRTWEELVQVCPEFAEVLPDATEQPRQRPPRRSQRRRYTGSRKRHTIKTQVTVTRRGRILAVRRSVPGRVHDDALFQQAGTARGLPPASRHDLDLGYEGAPGDAPPRATFLLPVTRRRTQRRLTRAERRCNRVHARLRMLVEHVFSRLKQYAILVQVYRHRIADDNRRFRNVAALVNFRLALALG